MKIGIIGLGYVGLPLCIEFGKKYQAIILTVAHNEFSHLNIAELNNHNLVNFDTKSFFKKGIVDGRL